MFVFLSHRLHGFHRLLLTVGELRGFRMSIHCFVFMVYAGFRKHVIPARECGEAWKCSAFDVVNL
jgi:hypothetical protein